ncbi:MAG: hypothetical protein K5629_00570 [Eubacteriales bacterium]|nr:hypothetical protein [Eubacteriales bacterium]
MDKKKLLICINAALYVLWALLISVSVVAAYTTGAAYRAQGHPEVWIFTREMATELFRKSSPLLLIAVIMSVICSAKGTQDGNQDKPGADPGALSLYRAERETVRDRAAESAEEKKLLKTRYALFALAVLFVVAGILNGSMMEMLIKAIKICTECLGLG